MTVHVLDSSALIRYLDKESGWERVTAILKDCAQRRAELHISAIQWGEIAGNLRKRFGASEEIHILSSLLPSEAKIIPATGDRAVRAAALKVENSLPYADAFALDLAMDSPDHVLITADYEFKSVTNLAQIEFLPAK